MDQKKYCWLRTVFRLRGLPSSTEQVEDVARLVSDTLGDTSTDDIRVFSLTTTLNFREKPRSKIATVMFAKTPSIVTHRPEETEWIIRTGLHANNDLILDTHFMGMTPLNSVGSREHSHE